MFEVISHDFNPPVRHGIVMVKLPMCLLYRDFFHLCVGILLTY